MTVHRSARTHGPATALVVRAAAALLALAALEPLAAQAQTTVTLVSRAIIMSWR